jgi:hypothetical protein
LSDYSILLAIIVLAARARSASATTCAPGTFRQAPATPFPSTSQVAFGDANGDGKLDFAYATTSAGQPAVAMLLAAGDGTFQDPILRPAPSGGYAFTLGDFDGDGKLDLVATAYQRISFYKGNGNGSFQDEVGTDVPYFGYPSAVFSVVLTPDGNLDLLLGAGGANTLFIKGKGDGTFLPSQVATAVGISEGTAIADLDGDGKLDLAVPFSASGQVGVLLGRGDGTTEARTSSSRSPIISPF